MRLSFLSGFESLSVRHTKKTTTPFKVVVMKAFLSNEITQAAFLSPLKISASAKHLRYLNAKAHDVFISLCKLSQSKLTNTPTRFNFSLYCRAIQRDLALNKNFRSDVIKSLASLQKLTIILNGSTKVKTRIFKTLEIKKRVFRFTLILVFLKKFYLECAIVFRDGNHLS